MYIYAVSVHGVLLEVMMVWVGGVGVYIVVCVYICMYVVQYSHVYYIIRSLVVMQIYAYSDANTN